MAAKVSTKNTSLEDMNVEELKKRCLECVNNKDLNTATRYFKEYIELIIFNLLISDHFFGTFIIHMQREIRYDFYAPAGVTIKKGSPLLVINPALLLRYTHKEVKAILKHEVYHLLHFHLLRSKENNNRFDSYIENIVMDVAINQFIPEIPDECVTFDNFCKQFKLDPYRVSRKESFEYYLELVKNSDVYKKDSEQYKQMMKDIQDILDQLNESMGQNGNGSGSGSGSGDGKNGKASGNGSGNGGKSIQEMLDEILDKKYPIDHSIWKESDSSDVQNIKEIVKHMVNEAIKNCGNVPGDLQELINKINEPTIIKWQDELKRLVGSVKCPYKLTPLRRPRRQPDRMDLKGKMSDRKVKIAVAIDTSGSMGERELQFVFSEIFKILELVKFEMTIIECDYNVQRVYKAKNLQEVDMNVKGRGGTAFTPVFKYLKEEMRQQDKPDLLVYFTDGWGESCLDEKYHISSSTKLMWVLTGRKKDLSCSGNGAWTNKIKELKMNER